MRKIDAVYNERNRTVLLAAALALRLGYHCWLGKVNDPTEDSAYAVYIEFPEPYGQVSWHIGVNELALADFLPREEGGWKRQQGTKYQRIDAFIHWLASRRWGHDPPLHAQER